MRELCLLLCGLFLLIVVTGRIAIAELSSIYGVHANQISKWKRQAIESLPDMLSNNGHKAEKNNEVLQDEF